MLNKKSRLDYVAIALVTAISTVWLSYQFWRLLRQPAAANGAVDLLYRYEEVTSFVAGIPVYWELSDAVYPPASYLMMWPILGWLPEAAVRPVWAITTLALLGVIIAQMLYIVAPRQLTQKVFLGLLPLSMYATGAAIGNGQIVIHLLPCLLGSFMLLRQHRDNRSKQEQTWARTFGMSFLMLLALVKPNVTAPFFWILLFRAPLAAMLTAATYVFMTISAIYFQPEFDGPVEMFKSWLTMGMAGAYYGATPYVEYEGNGSISTSVTAHSIVGIFNLDNLAFFEFSGWNQIISLAILMSLGVWLYQNKSRDVWVLASVTAIVSKYWTYHGWYDDLILVIPLAMLFKLSIQRVDAPEKNTWQPVARTLFVAMFLFMLAPGGTYLLPQPWRTVYLLCQSGTLLAALIFLARGTFLQRGLLYEGD